LAEMTDLGGNNCHHPEVRETVKSIFFVSGGRDQRGWNWYGEPPDLPWRGVLAAKRIEKDLGRRTQW